MKKYIIVIDIYTLIAHLFHPVVALKFLTVIHCFCIGSFLVTKKHCGAIGYQAGGW